MKHKLRIAFSLTIMVVLLLTSVSAAQYSGKEWGTAYNVVNTGNAPANITIDYYNSSGQVVAGASKTFTDVEAGGSRLVIQRLTDPLKGDPNLPSGRYSAVVSSSQPVAAIVNQELYPSGSTNPEPPFSSYSAEAAGAKSVFLPAVMHNYFNYYTEIFIMNVGTGPASVTLKYTPGTTNGIVTGTAYTAPAINIPQYASQMVSQQNMTNLAAPSGRGIFTGRFLGSVEVTSNQDVVVVVNQHNPAQFKLMSYNGFTGSATRFAAPVAMRGYYGYYTAISVANKASTPACVRMTYTPSGTENRVVSGSVGPVVVNHVLQPGQSLLRYDGPDASNAQSDLDDNPNYTRFYGSVLIESITNATCSTAAPIAVLVNVEAVSTGDSQAGSYNGIPTAGASNTLVAPVILADYYGYYTNLVVQNTTGNAGTCTVEYTSAPGSARLGKKSYQHTLPANGAFTVYEGRKGGQEVGDINSDAFWRVSGKREFIGAATITCTQPVVSFVNEERDILQKDSMYTFNAFNK